jgi:isocitrate dehydrogenase (NAD+)
MTPGANIGTNAAIFEAVHGTAPDIAGKGIANPGAVLLAGCMLLEHIGQGETAARVRRAFESTLRAGKALPRDLGGTASTDAFADAIIAQLS